jgi:hypothetical protein
MTERGLAAGDGNGSDRLVESTASKSGGPDGMSSIDNSLCLSRGVGGGNIDGSACCSCGPDGMSSIGNSLCFRRGVGGGSIDDSACCTVGADDVLSFTPAASENLQKRLLEPLRPPSPIQTPLIIPLRPRPRTTSITATFDTALGQESYPVVGTC